LSFSLKTLAMCALLSMAPVSELRGAIPVGLSGGVPDALLYIVCVLANILPVPFILLFLRRILDWMLKRGGRLRRAAEWLEERGKAKSDIYRKYETLGLFILVAIPLPGTGAWTGALVAGLLELRMKSAVPAIAGGVAAAGAIVMLVCKGVISVAGL
jgi:uncharacterized membrane protein